ncbi:MAG: ATP synthase F1 subunit epsilon [Actinomycetota bacterium]
MEVHVVSPERELWSGQAEMVVAKGIEGDVGILPGHAPMLVALAIHPVRILREGGEQIVLVDGGFLHVVPGEETTRVDVLAEHAALPDEIDAAAARARADDLQRRMGDEGQTGAQAELAKALMRAEHGSG